SPGTRVSFAGPPVRDSHRDRWGRSVSRRRRAHPRHRGAGSLPGRAPHGKAGEPPLRGARGRARSAGLQPPPASRKRRSGRPARQSRGGARARRCHRNRDAGWGRLRSAGGVAMSFSRDNALEKALVIGVDTGGTFTDFIAIAPDGRVWTHKRLSTPHDPAEAVLQGLDELLATLAAEGHAASSMRLVHGSTVATNAVLERRGARTALVVTAGFRDLLLIGRQNRRELYDLMPKATPPLIPRALSFEVRERLGPGGEVVTPLDEGSVTALLPALSQAGVESVAVVLLHSYANPDHERRVAEALREQGYFVSASCDILPEHREYERASTTALNAYVSPIMQRYLGRLNKAALEKGFADLRIMQSSGGVTDAEHAGAYAVHTILSGPAGGVVGALKVARALGIDHIITLDMGGTSTDVSLVPGALKVTTES